MRFEFATATRIIFGAGSLREVATIAAELRPSDAGKILVVTGRSPNRAKRLLDDLAERSLAAVTFAVEGEPTIEAAVAGRQLALDEHCELVIAIGGGSAIDAGKAIAALVTNPGHPLDYLEVIGKGRPLTHRGAPFIAIPTTAGAGAEVTKNAVLASPEHKVKVSLRSPLILACVAVVDPELTCDLPPHVTAGTGLDALTQLIEPFLCTRANPMIDALCRHAIPRSAKALPRAYRNGHDADARADLALASLFGGLALANAGLGAVHGFAGPIGGMFPAPHGQVCAALLPHVLAANLAALKAREPDSPTLTRFNELARLLTGCPTAAAPDGVAFVQQLCQDLAVPSLSAYGLMADDIPALVEKASAASSMKPNPIRLTPEEFTSILRNAM